MDSKLAPAYFFFLLDSDCTSAAIEDWHAVFTLPTYPHATNQSLYRWHIKYAIAKIDACMYVCVVYYT